MQLKHLESAMQRSLELALLGPAWGVNPQVGAVILDQEGRIVAEGYHKGSGTPHAEVMAIEDLKRSIPYPFAPGYTAVVTLEPCNHFGKTGPCAQALIDAGISRVVFPLKDPGNESAGGAQRLRDSGVEVIEGVLRDKAKEQARVWLSSKQLGRPFVTLKWASSLDGRIAATDGSSKWISGEESRRDAHLLRRDVDAILVGTGTVIADDPELTARDQNGNYFEHQPLRVVMGERALPSDKRVFNDKAETIQIRARNPQVVMQELQNRQVKHLLVEGGSKIASEFIRNNLVDEFIVYLAPLLLGGPRLAINDLGIPSMAEAVNLRITEQKLLGEDLFIRARR
ncbi:MAG: bifunctional diaminohydroxyphosphoribosylaminopyrimidine deaminase/5-amino-6-(5-phosphoribosylamino)uracil reductase RibD [Aquiluna sp.]|jgi:diaminohydroxyphosphoribosylaminopyrimidine deaminase/5-amino-6-(5-phosphoribosylamino)uracil reductase